jgi:hypothetical protein
MANLNFIVSGGLSRDYRIKLKSGQIHKKAVLAVVNWDEKKIVKSMNYSSPPEHCPEVYPSIRFTAMSFNDDKIILPTGTEVLFVDKSKLEIERCISNKYFNDVHFARIIDDELAVVSTGLERIVFLDLKTENIKRIIKPGNMDFKEVDETIDYRKINSTSPHLVHPNYLINDINNIYITRFAQKDIVDLNNPNVSFPVAEERIHDGKIIGGKIYFTSVDGNVIILDLRTKKILKKIDLWKIDERKGLLGWCRGIEVIDNFAYVVFSQFRKTKLLANIKWAMDKVPGNKFLNVLAPTRICKYNLDTEQKIDELIIDSSAIDTIFDIHLY